MSNDPSPNGDNPPDHFVFRRDDGHIDFFRAFQSRKHPGPDPTTAGIVDRRELATTVARARRLIREYCETAKRVETPLNPALLAKVIEALHRESQGNRQPLGEIAHEEPIERFLAESLYHELLEVPALACRSPKTSAPAALSPEDWRACLDELADAHLAPCTTFADAN